MKKIGLMCLALVLALGTLGVGFAAWTDTITISGNVNTGTLDLLVSDYSGTWVYKTDSRLGADGVAYIEVIHAATQPANPPGYVALIGYAKAEVGDNAHDIHVTFNNLFPCIDFVADFTVHYHGTIPANITVASLTVAGIPASWVVIGGMPDPVQVDTSTDYPVTITIHVPQPANGTDGQGLTGTISGTIVARQWNE